jgi:hypothetical protein
MLFMLMMKERALSVFILPGALLGEFLGSDGLQKLASNLDASVK